MADRMRGMENLYLLVFFLPVDDGHRGISPVRNEHESLGTASQQDVEVTPGKNFPRSGRTN